MKQTMPALKFHHTVPEPIIKTLYENNYDLVIDPSLFDTPVHRMKLLHEINPKSVLAFNKRKYFNHYSKSLPFYERDKEHVTKSASLIAEYLAHETTINHAYELHLPDTFTEEVRAFFSTLKNTNKVVINTLTGSKERDFSQEQLSKIMSDLNEKYDDIDIILLDHRKEITLALPENSVINPFKTLQHVMALIHECHLVISPDTAIVHISAAWKKNLIAVYKNVVDNNDLWAPGYDNASQIIVNNRAISQVKEVPELIAQEIKHRHLLD